MLPKAQIFTPTFPLDVNYSPMCEVGLNVKAARNVYTPANQLGLVKKPIEAFTLNLVFTIC